ncbi:MAG: DUF4367 domain-containing protein [Clostridiales bacterium]|nr:DUF4367 domain-containing protein [Clostridiales bacterium]
MKSERSDMKDNMNDHTLFIAGKAALDLIREEADEALSQVDWSKLEAVDLDDWFFDTLNKTKRKERYKRSLADRILVYAAAIVLAIFLTATLILATVEPARAALIRFLIERFPQYSEYSINLVEDEQPEKMTYVLPGYIPDGFEPEDTQDTSASRAMMWRNPETNQFIQYMQSDGESSVILDTEKALIRSIKINGVNAEVVEKGSVTTIQIFYKDTFFVVVSDASYEECLKIAESIPLN